MPHRSWWVPRKHRAVDKKGVAVALAFLVALGALAGGRGEKRDRVEDWIHRTPVPAQTLVTGNYAPDVEAAMMDGDLTIAQLPSANPGPASAWVTWISMPYLSVPFKAGAFSMESPAAIQTCSPGRPDLLPTKAGQGDSGQILRRPNPHWSSLLVQYVTHEGGTRCQRAAHPSALLLMTDNRLSENAE